MKVQKPKKQLNKNKTNTRWILHRVFFIGFLEIIEGEWYTDYLETI